MRIAFVAANRELLPDPVVPLGLLTLHAATPERHERRVLDLCFEDAPCEALSVFLLDFKPDLIALSLRNLQSADYGDARPNLDFYRSLTETIRAHGASIIVLGGAGFSLMPGPLLQALDGDYGVAGEGEWAFPRLLEELEADPSELANVPGVYARIEGSVRPPRRGAPFVDLNTLRHADRHLVDRRHYRTSGIESVQTSRGCAFECSYCTYPMIEGRQIRLRAPERVADELEHIRLAAPEAEHYFIVDSAFNRPRAHALAVCDAIHDRRIGLPFTCYVNPRGFESVLAARMAKAGCVGVEIGSDSGDDATLTRLRKGFDTSAIRDARDVSRGAGLLDCHTFVLGTPGETMDEVRRTLDFVSELNPSAAILMVWNDDAESLSGAPARSARVALREQILTLLSQRVRTEPRWVIPPLGRRFDARRFALLRKHGLRGPLWQHLGAERFPNEDAATRSTRGRR